MESRKSMGNTMCSSEAQLMPHNTVDMRPTIKQSVSANIIDEISEESLNEEGIKSGKYLIKNISKIEYGSNELSEAAIEFRKVNGITNPGRNVCVVEYKSADGVILRKAFVSNASNHSEEVMIGFLKENNILGKDVIKIFSEREPCVETATNIGHNCTKHIIEYMPDVEVMYVVDYGTAKEDGAKARRALKELLKELLN